MIWFEDYASDIQGYCDTHGLSFAKTKRMCRASGKFDMYLQYHDASKGQRGLLDESPAPVVLIMRVQNGKPQFEQTEYTQLYLSV